MGFVSTELSVLIYIYVLSYCWTSRNKILVCSSWKVKVTGGKKHAHETYQQMPWMTNNKAIPRRPRAKCIAFGCGYSLSLDGPYASSSINNTNTL